MKIISIEEKDIQGANMAGIFSVLIDRDVTGKSHGENRRISDLKELIDSI